MEARDFEELKKKLCRELEQIKNKNSLGMGEIEAIDKLTHSIKSLNSIIENEEGGGYSQGYYMRNSRNYGGGMSRDNGDGSWEARGSYGGDDYDRDNSYYSRRGMHYVRGHYSRAAEDISDKIQEMMDESDLTIAEKGTLKKALEVLRK